MASGIDVSNNNGQVDWGAAKHGGVVFAYAKATEGNVFVDSYFAQNRANAERVGIVFGGYHFYNHDATPAENVDHYLGVYRPRPGELRPVIDYETQPLSLAQLETAVVLIRHATGRYPVIYSSLWNLEQLHASALSAVARCPVWVAAWGSTRPAAPAPWKWVALWQRSATGHVPGHVGDVDLDQTSLLNAVRYWPAHPVARVGRWPRIAWTWARWRLGIAEYAGHRRDKRVRPPAPLHIPASWWRGPIRWYQNHRS